MSHFDPQNQQTCMDSKIITVLEKVSQAFRVMMWNSSKAMSLSPIQMQILIFVKFQPTEKCTVSYLANEFNMTKATISDAVKCLIRKAYLEKFSCVKDARSYKLKLTSNGKSVAEEASSFTETLALSMNGIPEENKEVLFKTLLQIVHSLSINNIIKVQRSCNNCDFLLEPKEEKELFPHRCQFLNEDLNPSEFRVDCPNHKCKTCVEK